METKLSQKTKYQNKAYLYILPALLALTVFLFWPLIQTIWRSLYLTNNVGQSTEFIGLENYQSLLASESFRNSLLVSFKFVVVVVVVGMILGFVTALLCQKKFPGTKAFASAYALPMAVASSSIALVFRIMLNPYTGIINKVFNTSLNWLTEPSLALLSVGVLTGWLNCGMNFLYFSSGLASIPDSLYEAASIDGANGIKQLIFITIPSMMNIIFFVLVTNIISAFQSFGQIRILTMGGPGESTNVIVYDIYKNAFMNYRYGYASAESIVLMLIIIIFTFILFKLRARGKNV